MAIVNMYIVIHMYVHILQSYTCSSYVAYKICMGTMKVLLIAITFIIILTAWV